MLLLLLCVCVCVCVCVRVNALPRENEEKHGMKSRNKRMLVIHRMTISFEEREIYKADFGIDL